MMPKIPADDLTLVTFHRNGGEELDVVANGENGIVYRGLLQHKGETIPVAVKQSYENDDAKVLREGQFLWYLRDTGYVPRLYGTVSKKGLRGLCLVQRPLADSYTVFDNYLDDFHELPKSTRLLVAKNLLVGLRAIHNKGVLLNDIHADNVWLDTACPKKSIAFIDMSLASYGVCCNKFAMQAAADCQRLTPEIRFCHAPMTKASDVYSLGVMLQLLNKGVGNVWLQEASQVCMAELPQDRDLDQALSILDSGEEVSDSKEEEVSAHRGEEVSDSKEEEVSAHRGEEVSDSKEEEVSAHRGEEVSDSKEEEVSAHRGEEVSDSETAPATEQVEQLHQQSKQGSSHSPESNVQLRSDPSTKREVYFLRTTKPNPVESEMVPKIPADDLTLATVEWNEHEELEIIGEGAHGIVYRGLLQHKGETIPVAVKESLWTDDEKVLREGQFLWYLRDTGYVPRLYGIASIEGLRGLCLVQRLLADGYTVFDNHQNYFEFPKSTRLLVAKNLLVGLRAIHNKGVLLNDIHGNNVLLDTECPWKSIAYIDLGLASYGICSSKFTIQAAADCQRLAPEIRFCHAPMTKASDVYSLGVMLQLLNKGVGNVWLQEASQVCMAELPQDRDLDQASAILDSGEEVSDGEEEEVLTPPW